MTDEKTVEEESLWEQGYKQGYADAEREFKEYIKRLRQDFERTGKI